MVYVQQITDGVSVAGLLFIVALGLGITFGVMKIINMAHGELITIGAYTAYFISTWGEVPFIILILAAFIVAGTVGYVMEKLVIKKLYGHPNETLLATWGVGLILQQVIRLCFGPEERSVKSPLSGKIDIGQIVIPYYRLFIIAIAIALLLFTIIIIFKTKFGMQLRSISQNREMSECLGMNTARIDTLTFAFGSGLAGIAGVILAPLKTVSPTMGLSYLVDSFMIVVLGGVGSLNGTAFGSLLIGESNQVLATFINEVAAKILVLVFIILIIRFKPEGLFRREQR